MAIDVQTGVEARGYPPLGSIEHLIQFAEASKSFRARKLEKLFEFLSEHRIAESIAYFIAQNDTPTRGRDDRTRQLDTRTLPYYKSGPVVHGEFHYNPWDDDNYVFLAGRRWRNSKRGYSLRMYLQDDLELDLSKPPEAHVSGGRYGSRTFRTYAFKEYREDRPAVLLDVLRTAANGLQQFVEARDNS